MFWTCLDMLGPALFLVSFLLEEQLWISWSQLNPDPWLCHFHCAAVAAGEYCLRENPNGVDLNRNWDEKWDLGTEHSAEQSHGKRPFSEPLDSMLSNFLTQSDSKQGRYGEIWGDTRKQVPWKVYEVISYIWIYMKLYMHIILIC
jgi:murein tripeptide amidase MpaA